MGSFGLGFKLLVVENFVFLHKFILVVRQVSVEEMLSNEMTLEPSVSLA